MGAGEAFVQGWRRTWEARLAVAGVALLTVALAAALPGSSAAFGPAARATGIGAGAVWTLAAGDAPPAAVSAHVVLALSALGALLARFTTASPLRLSAALDTGARRLFRLLRLAALPAAIVTLLQWLDLPGGAWTVAGILWVAALLLNHAEIRLSAEDRRVVLGALLASARFIRAHPVATLAVHAAYGALALATWMAATALAPPGGATWGAQLAAALPWLPLVVVQTAWAASESAHFDAHLGRAEAPARSGGGPPPPGAGTR